VTGDDPKKRIVAADSIFDRAKSLEGDSILDLITVNRTSLGEGLR
jgi:hypothetical protein